MNNRYKFLLFDVDDTLFDFEKGEAVAFVETMNSAGITVSDSGFYDSYLEINAALWQDFQNGAVTQKDLCVLRFQRLFDRYGVCADARSVSELYLDNIGRQAILFDDTYAVCERLSAEYELFMITNAVARVQRSRIKHSPITGFFKDVFISEEIGYVKPSKEFFDHVSASIPGFDRKLALVIGDSITSDIAGAIGYGIDCCFVNRRSKAVPDGIKPDCTVNDLWGLIDILA